MRGLIIVGALAATAGSARAQYRNPYNNMTWNNSFSRMMDMTNSMNQNLMNQMNRINMSRSQLRKQLEGEKPAAPPPAKVAHKPITATDFKPADKGHPVVDKFVAGFPLSPEDAASLKQALRLSLDNFEKETRKNNVATAFAIAIVAAVHVANNYDIPDAQSDEIVLSLNDAFAGSPQWKKMSARDKQTISDAMLVYAAMMLNLYGQPDDNVKAAGVNMARELLARLTPPQQ